MSENEGRLSLFLLSKLSPAVNNDFVKCIMIHQIIRVNNGDSQIAKVTMASQLYQAKTEADRPKDRIQGDLVGSSGSSSAASKQHFETVIQHAKMLKNTHVSLGNTMVRFVHNNGFEIVEVEFLHAKL